MQWYRLIFKSNRWNSLRRDALQCVSKSYSHSMVAGGFEVQSSITRLI